MELKREQFDQTNPFARQAALVQLARRATAADLRRVLEAVPPPELDVVVSTPEADGGGIHFTEVPPIPLGSERPPQTLPTVLPRRRRQKREDDRFVRLGWAIAETREYLRYAVQLQRSRIARWLGRRR
ncbi:hypothetical protein [Aromatoleum bremense]|uniref:Uncharacterized protein n=1 Tax=Aromatoleum bremense TaxID=76115 RepID=A0ABX1NYE2_9RHOO|nr:hypothetical protein [Aromatoleum bremense]NMG16977.1 hypothetical protein [Aromatoleum bremense]QTQ33231.1 Uncharacterized protein pbN1_32450 [Aromatoleum bremense]